MYLISEQQLLISPLFRDSLQELMLTATTIPLEEDLSALPREVSTIPLEAWGTNQIIGKICSDPRVNSRNRHISYRLLSQTLRFVWLKRRLSHGTYYPLSLLFRSLPRYPPHHHPGLCELPSLRLKLKSSIALSILWQYSGIARSKDFPGPPSYSLTARPRHCWASKTPLRNELIVLTQVNHHTR